MAGVDAPMFSMSSILAGRTVSRMQLICSMLVMLGQVTAAQTAPAGRVAVDFSHVAISLDSATFQAMASSSFLRSEFGGFEDRPSVPGSTEASFLYYGRDTYLEFLNARPLIPLGSQQLAFVVRHTGDLHVAVDALLTQRPRVIAYSLNFRRVRADSVALFWRARLRPSFYDLLQLNTRRAVSLPQQPMSPQPATLSFDILERHPGYLRRSDPTIPQDSAGVTNIEYLSRRWKPDGYLRSVIGVTLAADSTYVLSVAGDLAALGYDVRQVADTIIVARSGFTLKLLPATASRRGVLAVRMTTQRRKEGETLYRFGTRSILRFDTDSTAYWTF